jgi:formylglycine-generating enzyme required for sulfatase activity
MKGIRTKNALLFGTLVILVALLTVLVTLRRSPSDGGVAVGSVAKQATRVTNESTEEIRRDDSSSIQESIQLTPSEDRRGTNMARVTPDQTDQANALIGGDGEFVHPAHTNNPLATPLELVWIAPGTFVMGSSPYEKSRGRYEGPETSVTIGYGFWLGKYEVTIWQYKNTAGRLPRKWLADEFKDTGNDFPVTNVEWQEAMNFCRLLTQREREAGTLPDGYAYRLPTEAEWEYACRAGTNTRFSFGDDPNYVAIASYAWFAANSEGWAHPVGGKLPNPWGLYDMHRNVTEWCLDWLGDYPGGAVTNPLGAIPGDVFARRGGASHFPAHGCRSASRGRSISSANSEFGRGRGAPAINVGFRVALAPNLPVNAPE